jgi:hypothetical protein
VPDAPETIAKVKKAFAELLPTTEISHEDLARSPALKKK